ncbi:SDR family oxidoreductase [Streptomyces sp. NPDC048277]|uniref:SDR family oxidoreductase n=1 Tax=Streptomyces sp. NPDC048277 TaxID=3155027 RepID=UPI0034096C6A
MTDARPAFRPTEFTGPSPAALRERFLVEGLFGPGGCRALVTGAWSGSGAATPETLAAAGADVVLRGRTEDGVRATADACRALGRAVAVVGCDLADAGHVAATARAVAEEHPIDVLVNNTGTISRALAPDTGALRADPRREPGVRSRIPAGRRGTPDDMRGATVFPAGPAARCITGHTLVVGGEWMGR